MFELGWQLTKTSYHNIIRCGVEIAICQVTIYQHGQLLTLIANLANGYTKHMSMIRNLYCVQHYETLVHVNIILAILAYMPFENENLP